MKTNFLLLIAVAVFGFGLNAAKAQCNCDLPAEPGDIGTQVIQGSLPNTGGNYSTYTTIMTYGGQPYTAYPTPIPYTIGDPAATWSAAAIVNNESGSASTFTDEADERYWIVHCGNFNPTAFTATPQDFQPTLPGLYMLIASLEYDESFPFGGGYSMAVLYICVSAPGAPAVPTGQQAEGCGSVTLLDGDDSNYTWYWQTSANGTSTSRPAPYTATSSGTYWLRGRKLVGGQWTWTPGTSVTVTVWPQPVADPGPDISVAPNVGVTLTAANPGSGITNPTFEWTAPGQSIQTGQSINVTPGNGITYTLTVIDARSGCSDSEDITINVRPDPPAGQDEVLCMCDDPQPIVIQPGAGGAYVEWYDAQGNLIPNTANGYTPTSTENHSVTVISVSATGQESLSAVVTIRWVQCDKCLGSFAPEAGKRYVVSAWVKEATGPETKTYDNASISFTYEGSTPNESAAFKASGPIIEGWQRIEADFTIPATALSIGVKLNNEGATHDVFFDDIRIFPFDANMKSFVYDPQSLRLVAELDANNYATYYIYDREGNLAKVKKETTRGVKTLQEGHSSTAKN